MMDSKWTGQVKNKKYIFLGKEGKRYKNCITFKKMRDYDHINQFHHDAWFDYNKKTKLFCPAISGDDDFEKKSIASPSTNK